MSEYFIQTLSWLRERELASTWADVSGFVIAIVGFWATLVNVRKTRKAADAAQTAAQATRDSIKLFDIIVDFSTAIAVLEEIKRAHRETGVSETLPERYSSIRKQLIVLKGSAVKLSDEHLSVIQNAIANLSTMEDQIEKALASKAPFPIAKYNALISRDIDKLVDVFTALKANQETRNDAA